MPACLIFASVAIPRRLRRRAPFGWISFARAEKLCAAFYRTFLGTIFDFTRERITEFVIQNFEG